MKQTSTQSGQELQTLANFGVYVGRFQYLTIGHETIVNEILLDGRIPVIVIGSCNKSGENNPLTYEERVHQFKLVFPDTTILFVKAYDYEDWDTWYFEMITSLHNVISKYVQHLNIDSNVFIKPDSVMYINNKEEDRIPHFVFNDTDYKNTFYTDVFKDSGWKVKEVSHVMKIGISKDVSARHVRADLEANKYMLHYRIYEYLKQREKNGKTFIEDTIKKD